MNKKSATQSMIPTPAVLSDDLIVEVLSFLPVKSLLRFKCVNKSWKTLISDPAFVKLHLNKSVTRDPLCTLVTLHTRILESCSPDLSFVLDYGYSIVPYSVHSLIQNPSFTLSIKRYCCFFNYYYNIVGSCNGLICLSLDCYSSSNDEYMESWLHLWNPATRTVKTFQCFPDCGRRSVLNNFSFNFGFDDATNTYKVVAFRYNPQHQFKSEVKIVSLPDNVWRDIESFPVVPLHLDSVHLDDSKHCMYGGVYLSGSFNWLAIHNHFHYDFEDIEIDQFVIVSLNLTTETYHQFMLPREFDEVPLVEPTVRVLEGCLCFSYSKDADFVIWRMMTFGVEDSWTQFLKLSYQDLLIDSTFSDYETLQLVPLLLYEDGDTLILKSNDETEAIICNWRDGKVGRIEITTKSKDNTTCWYSTMDYVESLVPIVS